MLLATISVVQWRRQSVAFPVPQESVSKTLIATQLTFEAGLQMNPAISPDGKFAAYASNQSGNFDIWVKAIDSPSPPIQITSDPAHDWQTDWPTGGIWMLENVR